MSVHYGFTIEIYEFPHTTRIAGKFGSGFNLAVWRIVRTSPNLNLCQI